VFSALSVPQLYNMGPLAAKKSFLIEFRACRVIEQKLARILHSDFKC
jgi:hypothetical protein